MDSIIVGESFTVQYREDALQLAFEWSAGTRSHWNTYCGMSDNRPLELAMCAIADAQEVVKWTALAAVLPPRPTEPF